MVEPRSVSGLQGLGIGRPKTVVGLKGPAAVGGQTVLFPVRLYGSPTVVVWSKGRQGGRAKIAGGAGVLPGTP
jgi:hypothetical protein